MSPTHFKRYYLKVKKQDETYVAWILSNKQLDSMKAEITFHQGLELYNKGILLQYKGTDNQIPTLDKINRSTHTFLKFETYDYDLELEMKLRVLKRKEYSESELWGFLIAVSLYMDELHQKRIVLGN